MSELVGTLEARLRAVATPERAEQEKRYLKSDLDFLGATLWQVEAAVRESLADCPEPDRRDVVRDAEQLWARPIHELRAAAVMLLERFADRLEPTDLPFLERLLRESRTWALVDPLAVNVVGPLLERDRASVTPILDRWATDADFWIRRTSLLAELRPLRAGAPLGPFLGRADAMLDEKEFFIRKAIGWVLREVGKRRGDEVAAWLAPRTDRASGVTMREAVKYLPPEDAERLLRAYRERRPATT
jgi:3-methyladenine DNA glycosylase AlkD